MTLHIYRAERTDLLADGLAGLLAEPLPNVFDRELVVVPARGVERWLTQRLSHRLGVGDRGGDGICAGVQFVSPRSLVTTLLDRDRQDPWDPDRLAWPLLRVIDSSLGEPWCTTLAAHLGHGSTGEEGRLRQSRRYSVARRLAGLFASYAVQRPQLIADWRLGEDTDGAGAALDEDLRWQPHLWRRLLAEIDALPPDVRHRDAVTRLREGATELDLPTRLSLFGHTRLAGTEIELLRALAEVRDVHLWLPQVSGRLWDALGSVADGGPVLRSEDGSLAYVEHPLLASLGRDARELRRTLGVIDSDVDLGSSDPASEPTTLLGRLQHDLRSNREPDATTRAARSLAPADRSVQVHACHGATRQVDVLREVLVGLLEDDPTLEPRDILVMCPDIEAYAPLIQAGFGLADLPGVEDGHPAHRLRVRLADRSLQSINPLLSAAGTLVEMVGRRVTATQVLDLASAAPVRRRFWFSDDDLAQVTLWVEQAGIRWGLDAEHRAPFGLELADNSWDVGLSRILLGATMSADEHRYVADALPLDGVSSGDVELAGRFAEFVDRLRRFVDDAAKAATIGEWVQALVEGVDQLTVVEGRDAWQRTQFEREMALISDSSAGGDDTSLMLADVRNLLTQRLGGRPTRENFRTGTLTVCTMVPMRSVPHRVVCLVGLDDGVFPRAGAVDGDDALARRPMTGERDVRSEDRQLFLDAILAARETLVITYTGANEHTGAERPPAVPLGELLDALDTTLDHEVRDRVVVRHPLQPFDARNHLVGEIIEGSPFSFDASALAGSRAMRAGRRPVPPLIGEPLPARPTSDVNLADLQAFFAHPVRAFLRARLDVSAPLSAEEPEDAIPITLNALDAWQVGDRILNSVLAGSEPEAAVHAERLRGELPPGQLADKDLADILGNVVPIVGEALELQGAEARTVDLDVELVAGRRLTGTVTTYGNRLISVTYSSLGAKHRLASWIDLLAVSVAFPDTNWTAHALGKGRGSTSHAIAGPLDERALIWLRELVDIYDRGMREPLPLPVKTACAYAEASAARERTGHDETLAKARSRWETDRFNDRGIPGEDADAAHVQVFGDHAPLDVLLTPARTDEQWSSEPHRLGQYAWRLWGPLLDGGEKVTHR